MYKITIYLISLIFLLSGCKIYKRILYTYDSVDGSLRLKNGMSEDDVISKIGTPANIEELNNLKVLYFCRSDDVKKFVHVILEEEKIIDVFRYSVGPEEIEDDKYDCKFYFQKENLDVFERKSDMILSSKGVEFLGYFHGIGHGWDFLRGYHKGLGEVEKFDEKEWEREVSFQFGYLKSVKTNKSMYSFLVGRWSAFHDFQNCEDNNLNEKCKKYIEIKPEGIL